MINLGFKKYTIEWRETAAVYFLKSKLTVSLRKEGREKKRCTPDAYQQRTEELRWELLYSISHKLYFTTFHSKVYLEATKKMIEGR